MMHSRKLIVLKRKCNSQESECEKDSLWGRGGGFAGTRRPYWLESMMMDDPKVVMSATYCLFYIY